MNRDTDTASWSKELFEQLFAQSQDVKIKTYLFGENGSSEVVFVFSEGTSDSSAISKTVLPALEHAFEKEGGFHLHGETLSAALPLVALDRPVTAETMAEHLFEGGLLIAIPHIAPLFRMDISKLPQRTPEESSTEISIKGPRDGFVENVAVNVALIRKRIRSSTVCCEFSILGRRTKTKIALMYVSDIISPQLLDKIRERLGRIDVDGIYSIGQIEELVVDRKRTLLPLIDYTGRPDYTVNALLSGRFVILVDGNPMVLIGPAAFTLLLKSPEDLHFQFQYTSFARIIRLISLLITLLLPGVWVALVAYNQDQIPFRLMATITTARLGLPFPAQMELFLLLTLLEIFREAGSRLPSSIGSTLTVVGGLIIGDASVRAGLVSPSSVVVGALTAVSSSTLVNQNLSMAVSLIRFGIFLVSSVFGMYGLIMSVILLVFYLATLRSFGVPYLTPLSPPVFRDWASSFLRRPWRKMRKRPAELDTRDSDRRKG